MTLGEKVRSLRTVEGELRGLGREMSQLEVAGAIQRETGAAFSQSYLSQIESGARPHLTHRTRGLLAQFFKVHPGYLVSDPPGFHRHLTSALRAVEDRLDEWLGSGVDQFGGDAELQDALLRLMRHPDSRKCLVLLGTIIDTPELVDRLRDALTSVPPSSTPPSGHPEWLQ
jgi:transcriptional regulator with XRE-family HTH domain